MDKPLARQAERFLRAVYCCETDSLDALSNPEVCISYPIFEKVLGAPAVRGKDAARAFSRRFCSRWSAPELTVHATVSEGDRVVLVWSFQATPVTPEDDPQEPHRWGGISYFRFDSEGRVMLELGEESTPGPWARVHEGPENAATGRRP